MAEAASQNSAPQSPNDLQSVHSTTSVDNNGTSNSNNGDATADKNTVNTNSKKLWMKKKGRVEKIVFFCDVLFLLLTSIARNIYEKKLTIWERKNVYQ